jgi:hypothetical protein
MKYLNVSRLISSAALLIAGMAHGATLLVDRSPLEVSVLAGTYTLATLDVTSSGAPLLGLTASTTTPWLPVIAMSGISTPANIFTIADARALSQGVYLGSISISAIGAENSPLFIPVTLTVMPEPATTPEPATYISILIAGGILGVAHKRGKSLAGQSTLED